MFWENLFQKLNQTDEANIYLFNFNNKKTRERRETCSKLTTKTLEQRQWRRSGVCVVDFENFHIFFQFFYYWLSTIRNPFKENSFKETPFNLFQPNVSFLYSLKRQKTKGFLAFSGGIEMKYWTKMGLKMFAFQIFNIMEYIK